MTEQEFVKDAANWDNYKFNLWKAINNTSGKIVEFGCGMGSTELLRKFCKENNREFESYENKKEYADSFGSKHVSDWDEVNLTNVDVLFIDHAPGERRWVDIKKYANVAKVIVVHDSEPNNGYMLDKVWALFKYRYDYKTSGAWTTNISNFVDVQGW